MARPGARPGGAPRGRSHHRGRPSRPCPRARRRHARPAARLPPARDPPEPPARLPRRADAAGPSELDARHESRQPPPASAPGRACDGAVVLQPPTPRSPAVARGDEARLLGPPALERAAHERGAVPHGCAAAAAAGRGARRELGPHRRQGRHLAALRPLRRPEPRDGGRPAPLPRHRAGAGSRHRLAADRPVPPHQAARRVRRAAAPLRARSRRAPSSSSAATRRATRPTRGGSSSVSSSGGTAPRASACSFSSGPTRATPAGRSASRPQLGTRASCVQEASYSDIEELATLLQHADVVVCNAGTILLDALVGDRPAVCVLYDEGAPPGESWAAKNVVGEHYQELAASGAFHRAERFEEVVAGIERALAQPDELAEARRRAVEQVVGRSTAARPSASSTRWPRSSGSPWDEARDDAPRARRGRRRRRADRVPPPCRRRFRVATDNASSDGTTEILERYERAGVLRLIREPADDMRQDEWVTGMARLAATEHGADWVINSDADEFWWPRGGSLKDVLATVPDRFGVVRGCWRHFLPRPDDGAFFAERMTVRLATPAAPGRQGDDLPRPPEGRAPRARRRRDRAREPQRRRAGARAAPRLASDRGPALLLSLGRPARAQGTRRLAPQPGIRGHRPSAAARRGVSERRPRRPLRLVRRRRRGARARPGGGNSRGRHPPARRAARPARGRRDVRPPGRGATARVPPPDRARGRRVRGGGLRARRDRRNRPRRAPRARARASPRRARGRAAPGCS